MSKERVGIIVDSLNWSKQIFDYLKMSSDSKNYEITHLIVQKNSYLKNNNLIEKSKNYLKPILQARFSPTNGNDISSDNFIMDYNAIFSQTYLNPLSILFYDIIKQEDVYNIIQIIKDKSLFINVKFS